MYHPCPDCQVNVTSCGIVTLEVSWIRFSSILEQQITYRDVCNNKKLGTTINIATTGVR